MVIVSVTVVEPIFMPMELAHQHVMLLVSQFRPSMARPSVALLAKEREITIFLLIKHVLLLVQDNMLHLLHQSITIAISHVLKANTCIKMDHAWLPVIQALMSKLLTTSLNAISHARVDNI